MPSLSGVYTSFSGHTLGVDEEGRLVLVTRASQPKTQSKLRANAEFWLCRDDGLTGKFGNPDKVKLRVEDQEYHIWVEPRGFSEGENEYGLVPVVPGEGYSSRFLAVDDKLGLLRIVDEWTTDQAKFREDVTSTTSRIRPYSNLTAGLLQIDWRGYGKMNHGNY